MDVIKMVSELRDEVTAINDAILSLERLRTLGKRRGRSAAWMRELSQIKERSRQAVKRRAAAKVQ